MFIIKNRDGTNSWYVYHKDATYSGSNPYSTELYLDTTDRAYSAGTWNNAAPTSTSFQTSAGGTVNGNDVDYICYAFAEKTGYSKFGKYTGNGNADGTFIYTGFKPAFIMVKRIDSTNNWHIYDNKRPNPFNEITHVLLANDSVVEQTSTSDDDADFLSNGVKMRCSNNGSNGSGASYIYMAFGQSLVGSNNIPCTAR